MDIHLYYLIIITHCLNTFKNRVVSIVYWDDENTTRTDSWIRRDDGMLWTQWL